MIWELGQDRQPFGADSLLTAVQRAVQSSLVTPVDDSARAASAEEL